MFIYFNINIKKMESQPQFHSSDPSAQSCRTYDYCKLYLKFLVTVASSRPIRATIPFVRTVSTVVFAIADELGGDTAYVVATLEVGVTTRCSVVVHTSGMSKVSPAVSRILVPSAKERNASCLEITVNFEKIATYI